MKTLAEHEKDLKLLEAQRDAARAEENAYEYMRLTTKIHDTESFIRHLRSKEPQG